MTVDMAYGLLDLEAEEIIYIDPDVLLEARDTLKCWEAGLEEQRRQLAIEIAEHDEKLITLNGMLAKVARANASAAQ